MKTAMLGVWFFFVVFFSASAACANGADKRDTESPFGVLDFLNWNHDWNSYQYPEFKDIEKVVSLMKEAHVGMIRLDFSMMDLELGPDQYDFKKCDRIVELLAKNDIRILGLIGYNAPWTGKEWNDAPDPDQFVSFVRTVVNRYKDRVKFWEIWNEPEARVYWKKQDGMKTYTELLKAVYPVIKKEDPSSVVLMGATSDTHSIALKQIYRNGGKGYFDIVNVHPFVDPVKPNVMARLKGIHNAILKVMETYGDGNKDIWWTELGAPGVKHPDKTNGWWEGISPTEEQQADWVKTIYGEPLKWKGVKKIFWAFFRETKHFNSGVDYFGIVARDFSKKPAFYAYQDMAKK